MIYRCYKKYFNHTKFSIRYKMTGLFLYCKKCPPNGYITFQIKSKYTITDKMARYLFVKYHSIISICISNNIDHIYLYIYILKKRYVYKRQVYSNIKITATYFQSRMHWNLEGVLLSISLSLGTKKIFRCNSLELIHWWKSSHGVAGLIQGLCPANESQRDGVTL